LGALTIGAVLGMPDLIELEIDTLAQDGLVVVRVYQAVCMSYDDLPGIRTSFTKNCQLFQTKAAVL
jgi:hypothetical protein